MSSLVVAKLAGSVILGTDSRLEVDGATVSDGAQKIFQVGQDAFYAWSGWTPLAEWQVSEAQRIVSDLGTSDIQTLARELDARSRPQLLQLVELLGTLRLQPAVAAVLRGEEPLHAYALAGRSGGEAGFIVRECWLQGEEIVTRGEDRFELPARENFAMYLTRGRLVDEVVRDPNTWAHGAVAGVEKLISELSARHSSVGGPIQLVEVTKASSCWIHRLDAETPPEEAFSRATLGAGVVYANSIQATQIAAGTLNANVTYSGTVNCSQINAGTIYGVNITGSAATITGNINVSQINTGTLNGFTLQGGTFDCSTSISIKNGGTAVGSLGASGSGATLNLNAGGSSQCSLVADGTAPKLRMGGTQVITLQQTGPGNTTDTTDVATRFNNLLTALRTHGLIT